MEAFRDLFDARQLEGIRLPWDAQTVRDERHGGDHDIAVRDWKKHRWYWGGGDASERSCYFSNTDLARFVVWSFL